MKLRLSISHMAIAGVMLLAGQMPALADNHAATSESYSKAAVIRSADLGGIEDWRAESNDTLYVEGRNNRWYKATFYSPCFSLKFANTIAFITEPDGDLDKFSSVMVDGDRCYFRTFERLDSPPA